MTDLDKLIAAVDAGDVSGSRSWSVVGMLGKTSADRSDFRNYADMAFRGSLDAARRLHEALLPGAGWDIWRTLDHMPDGESRVMYGCDLPMIDTVYSPVASRSWLLAILRALKAKEDHNGTV